MFRLQFQPQHRHLLDQICPGRYETEFSVTSGDAPFGRAVVYDDAHKAAFEATGLCGRGIAILGTKGFAADSNVLTLTFDTVADAALFKSWLCSRGEQDFWITDDNVKDPDEPNIHFSYHDPGGSHIPATRKR